MLLLVPTRYEAERLLDGVVPEDERPVASCVGGRDVQAALVGFGPVAAGLLATRALEAVGDASPVVLAGLAGTYRPEVLPVGDLLVATEARMGDLGRGRGAGHLGPQALGFPQVPASGGRAKVVDRLPLAVVGGLPSPVPTGGVLLTVAAASATTEEADLRAARHPDVLAEDMEAFAVALAAYLAARPCAVLRAISNVAGDVDRKGWEVDAPLRRLAGVLARLEIGGQQNGP